MSINNLVVGILLLATNSATASGTGEGPTQPRIQTLPPMEKLGKALFFDTNLSKPAGQSCASCHDPDRAFTDPDSFLSSSEGATAGRFGPRNSPTAMYASFISFFHFDEQEQLHLGGQFFDGRAATLEAQAKQPLLNPLEMNNPDPESVVVSVRTSAYAPLFLEVFGPTSLDDTELAFTHIAQALTSFEHSRAFSPFTSKYDAYLAGKAKLTEQELRGLKAFEAEDKGNCAACHPSQPAADGTPPQFTDFSYDNLGSPRNPHNPFYRQAVEFNPDGYQFVDLGLGAALGQATENGKFKVPTLRNIAITAPYGHNGYFRKLANLVDFYNSRDVKPSCPNQFTTERKAVAAGCWPAPEVAENVNTDELGDLGLTEQEVNDIVAFMGTLTDGWRKTSP